MSESGSIRRTLFVGGVAALAISLVVLVGNFFRPVVPGVMLQAEASRPWIEWGLGWAAAGFVLCFFGEGRRRVLSLVAGMILLAWWYGAWMALAR